MSIVYQYHTTGLVLNIIDHKILLMTDLFVVCNLKDDDTTGVHEDLMVEGFIPNGEGEGGIIIKQRLKCVLLVLHHGFHRQFVFREETSRLVKVFDNRCKLICIDNER